MSERVSQGVPQPQGFDEDPLTHFSRVFCRFLQLLFKTFEKGAYHWDPDDKNSDILITDQAPITPENVEKRPAIVVQRGPAAFGNVAFDQFAGPLLHKDVRTGQTTFTPNLDPTSGSHRHTDLISATMTYNCLSKEGLEAQRIAWIAGYFTRTLKRVLLHGGLHRVGEEVNFSSESAPGSIVQPDANEIVMVSVGCPFFFQDTWTVTPDKLLLTEIDVALRSEVGWPAPGAVAIKDPAINGRVIGYTKLISLDSKIRVTGTPTPKPRK